MLTDVRYALRSLGKSPTFTVLSAVCLALGIGANTAVFSLLDAALLRRLPVPEPDRLVIVEGTGSGPGRGSFSYPTFRDLREHATAAVDVFAYARADLNLSAGGVTDTPTGLMVSDNYFLSLEVRPALGRDFVSPDEAVVVLSDRYWRARFQGDTAIVGRSLIVNGLPFIVAGVLPTGFFGTEVGRAPDVFVPLALRDTLNPAGPRLAQQNTHWLRVMARLARGVTPPQAAAQLEAVYRRHVDDVGGTVSPGLRRFLQQRHLTVVPGAKGPAGIGDQFGGPLRILMATAGVVMLIACVNVAGLLLARAISRRREIAIRLALGAARSRVMRQLLVESAVLSIAGGGAGLLIGVWSANALMAMLSDRVLDVSLDRRMLAFTVVMSTITTLTFGAVPAMRAAHVDLTPALKVGPTSAPSGRPIGRLLLPVQIALTLLLLMGAGLFGRSLVNLRTMDAGFRADTVVVATLNPALSRFTLERTQAFYAELVERAAALPGVQSAALADAPLLAGAFIDGLTVEGSKESAEVSLKVITPRFLETMGIRLLAGRDFAASDTAESPPVAIVNETVARRYLSGRSAIGARIDVLGMPGTEIIGVIADTKYRDLRAEVPNTVYLSMSQAKLIGTERTLHVRATADPDLIIPALRDQIRTLDSTLPARIRRFTDIVDTTLERERLIATLSGVFAGLALVLTAAGLFGLIAHSVERRTREIGIRISLGAQSAGVVWMVVRDCLIVAGVGIAAGTPLALWMSGAVRAQLFGVSPYDPATALGAVAGLVLVALLAAYVPARRASRVDPIVALRQE